MAKKIKNNWTDSVNAVNRELYTIPSGWDTREQVAATLQCSPDRVQDLLKPGLAAGKFESRQFSVWDEKRRLAIKVVCYRVVPDGEPADDDTPAATPKVGKSSSAGRKSIPMSDRIKTAILANPGSSDGAVAHKVFGARAPDVARVRATMRK